MQIIHDTADGGPLSEGQVQAIKQQEMRRRLAAGEALPGDDFVLIVREIVHPKPTGDDGGRA